MTPHRTISPDALGDLVLKFVGKFWYQGPRSYFRSTVRSEIFIGRLTIKSPQFVLPLSISRYGIASRQHGNGNDGTQDKTKTGGGTWRGGSVTQRTNHKQPQSGNQDSAQVAFSFVTFALPQLTVRRCHLNFQAQGHPNLNEKFGETNSDRC